LLESARASLNSIPHDTPADAEILLADMIEASLPTAQQVVDCDNDKDRVLELMRDRLARPGTLPDYQTDDMKSLFRTVVRHALATLLDDTTFTGTIAPQINRAVLARLTGIAAGQDELNRKYGSLAGSLDKLRDLNLQHLQILARRFGVDDAFDLKSGQLRDILVIKAEEYHALKSEIDANNEGMHGLANMKAAAKDAIDRLDFDEVEHLLSMVHSAELEETAKTAALRAGNALMRGRAAQAFDLLNACANSFGGDDNVAPARKRLEFADLLYQHGVRYGGQGLEMAVRMNTDALDTLTRARQPQLWARAQNNLGAALTQQGRRTGGAAGNDLLAQAVTAYRDALNVYTQDAHPVDWATTQENLAIFYLAMAQRDGCVDPRAKLQRALKHVKAALTVFDQDHMPFNFNKATEVRDTIIAALG